MLCIVKMPLKREVGGHALNSHGNYIVDHGNSWNNHEIVFLNLCGNPGLIKNNILISKPNHMFVCTQKKRLNETALFSTKTYVKTDW